MCCGADTFMSREPRGQGPQLALGPPPLPPSKICSTSKAEKAWRLPSPTSQLTGTKTKAQRRKGLCSPQPAQLFSSLGTLPPTCRTVWGEGLAGKVGRPREPGPPAWSLLTAPILYPGCLGHTWPVDPSTVLITGSKPQAKWLLPTGYPTSNSLADSTQPRPREMGPIQVLVAQDGRSCCKQPGRP